MTGSDWSTVSINRFAFLNQNWPDKASLGRHGDKSHSKESWIDNEIQDGEVENQRKQIC